MIYKDPEILLHITHYGYSTGWGADGDWTFPGDKKFLQSIYDIEIFYLKLSR